MNQELHQLLADNVVSVKFTKINGEERVMSCTLMPNFIVENKEINETKKIKKPNANVMSVWSVEDKGWRSFRTDSVIEYKVI